MNKLDINTVSKLLEDAGREHLPGAHAFQYKGMVWSGNEHMDAIDKALEDLGRGSMAHLDQDINESSFGIIGKNGEFIPYGGPINTTDALISDRFWERRGEPLAA